MKVLIILAASRLWKNGRQQRKERYIKGAKKINQQKSSECVEETFRVSVKLVLWTQKVIKGWKSLPNSMADPPLLSTGHLGGFFFLWSALTQQKAMGLVQKLRSDLQEARSDDQNVLKQPVACEPLTSGLHNWREFDFRRGQRIWVNVSRVLDPARQPPKGEL